MNRFTKPDLKTKLFGSFGISLLIFIVIMTIFLYGIFSISSSDVMNEQQILFEAVNRDVVHCYAIEGMYPPDVKYMEDHYGLTFDKNKFIVDYEYIGSNIMPKVTIIAKQGGTK